MAGQTGRNRIAIGQIIRGLLIGAGGEAGEDDFFHNYNCGLVCCFTGT
jgi:hypothetical protein